MKRKSAGPGIPEPFPGLVIRYAYLWRHDHLAGKEEGVKDRPCAIVLCSSVAGTDVVVTVAPVTHVPPENPATAVEIPAKVKAHLKLDSARSWIVCTEVNRFVWPGPDLRKAASSDKGWSYGVLPPALFEEIKRTLLKALLAIVSR